MRAKKLEQVPGLDEMLRKMSGAFERINESCNDLHHTSNNFLDLLNIMDMQITTIQGHVRHQRGHFDQIFRDDDI